MARVNHLNHFYVFVTSIVLKLHSYGPRKNISDIISNFGRKYLIVLAFFYT